MNTLQNSISNFNDCNNLKILTPINYEQKKYQKANSFPAQHIANTSDEWSEPIDFLREKETPVLPFKPELLPSEFTDMIYDEASRMLQVPPDFIAIPMTVALSSLISYKINIRPKQLDDWTVVCNLWGVIIGSPSLLKTSSANAGLEPLKMLEKLAVKRYNKQIENPDFNKVEPIRKRYILGDSTTEKTQVIQAENEGRGILIYRDELSGLIGRMESTGRENDRAYYLEAWPGDNPYINDTISRGSIEVPNNTLSILGTSQPGPWSKIIKETKYNSYKNDGFAQRFQLAVKPDSLRSFDIVDRKPNEKARQHVYDVFRYLDELDPDKIGAKKGKFGYYLNFNPEAQKLFYEWFKQHEIWLRNDANIPEYLLSHFSKYRSLIPSLALIIHLASKKVGNVDVESITKAIGWYDYLKSHAYRLYGEELTEEEQAASKIASKLLSKELPFQFTERELYRKNLSGISSSNTKKGLHFLVNAGWGKLNNVSTGNKPSKQFVVNPKIYSMVS